MPPSKASSGRSHTPPPAGSAPPPPHANANRGTLLCVGLSLILMAVSLPMLHTLVRQILSMFPMPYVSDSELAATPWPSAPIMWAIRELDEPITPAAYKQARDKVAEDRRILAVRYALNTLHIGRRADWDRVREIDPDNAVYGYLQALQALRAGHADEARVLELLRSATSRPPGDPTAQRAHLYLARQRELAVAGFRDAGISPRRAAAEAGRLGTAFRELHAAHRPVLREFTDRLLARASAWAAAGRVEDAATARDAVLRLFSDLAAEERSHVDLVALAAECELKALRARLPGVEPADENRLRAVERFVARWREPISTEEVNILPWTGDVVLARAEHDTVLRSLATSALCVGSWCVLLAIVSVSGIAALWGRSRGGPVASWRCHGAWLAPVAVVAPLLPAILLLATVHIPFVWLLSAPTTLTLLFSPWVAVALVGAAARVSVQLRPAPHSRDVKDPENARVPLRAMYVAGILLAAVVLSGFLFLSFRPEAFRPPLSVQYVRKLGLIAAFGCFVLSVFWVTWGQARRWRRGLAVGVLARTTLPVAARALLVVSVLSLAALVWNSRNDARHTAAFAIAAADPISHRLGSGAADVLTNVTATTRPTASQPAGK